MPDLETLLQNLLPAPERHMIGVSFTAGGKLIQAALPTHILRPDIAPWQDAAFIEVFCQTLAQRAGLPAIDTQQIEIAGISCSIARRYDVIASRKLKSETLAQRLGAQANLADCFKLLEEISVDVRADQQTLMDMVLYSALIGNSSADASLFGLTYEDGVVQIAPLHGTLCTAVFPHLPQRFALPIGLAHEPGQLRAADWALLASATQLEPAALATRALDLAHKVRGESRGLAMSLAQPQCQRVITTLLSAIEHNTMMVAQSLKGFLNQRAA